MALPWRQCCAAWNAHVCTLSKGLARPWAAENGAMNKRLGRPQGEISQAMLQAVQALATDSKGATLREAAAYARVSLRPARQTLGNLRRAGAVVIARTRRVPYRNRPVAEYALPPDGPDAVPTTSGIGLLAAAWGCGASPAPVDN